MDEMEKSRVALISFVDTSLAAQSIALELSKQGFRLALIGSDRIILDNLIEKLCEVSPLARSKNSKSIFSAFEFDAVKCLEYEDELVNISNQFIEVFERIDLLLNNAAHLGQGLDIEHDRFLADFCVITRCNLEIAIRLSQLMSRHLIEANGVVINLASGHEALQASIGSSSIIGYATAKTGLAMLTNVLANAFQGKSVRVIGIESGRGPNSNNHNFPYKPGDSFPDRLAELVLFLTSDDASYIHGTTIKINRAVSTGETIKY